MPWAVCHGQSWRRQPFKRISLAGVQRCDSSERNHTQDGPVCPLPGTVGRPASRHTNAHVQGVHHGNVYHSRRLKEVKGGAGDMAQWRKAFVSKPNDPSLIPRFRMVEGMISASCPLTPRCVPCYIYK